MSQSGHDTPAPERYTAMSSLPVRVRPLTHADRSAAARIYVDRLFDEEVRPMMPRHPSRAEAVFSELIQPGPGSWVAESDHGDLLGLALYQEPRGAPPSMVNWRALRRHLPAPAAVRAWIVSRYLYRVHIRDDELYLQSLAVAQRWQGKGVGTTLVDFVCVEAHRLGYRAVTLVLVDGNERARRLYERLGFSKVRTTRTRLYRPLVGWTGFAIMEKEIGRDGAPPTPRLPESPEIGVADRESA